MNKHPIILGIAVLLICVGLSGCIGEQNSEPEISDSERAKQIEEDYLNTVRRIGNHFHTQNDVLTYNQSLLDNHKEELNSYDLTLLSTYGTYAGNYEELRENLISGLEYIIQKNWELAWKHILWAEGELFDINIFTGDMSEIDVGLGNLEDILQDMKEE